jgi:3-deoxy-manno-octulosonate cytidylyltransferase (CMP-KDO synthetase)
MRIAAIIPCRFKSTRFPGKPLADIGGKPMMWHVYVAAKKVEMIDAVHIATDDDRIESACKTLGMNYIRTSEEHLTGTDRLTECLGKIDADYYVNVQGDEPMIDPMSIQTVARAMISCTEYNVVATNGYAPIENQEDISSVNMVKVVLTASNRALTYSRLPVPYPRGEAVRYNRQVGIYCFTRKGLELFATYKPGPIERSESIEMLRFLENDNAVLMAEVKDQSVPVDTELDLLRVRELMHSRNF